MQPGFVTVATYGNPPTEMPPANGHTSGRRRALAEWLVSPENPLTARVIVNRIWHHHFGRGIVATLDNFGKMGEAPTHPELLDWLALEFMDRGWSVKQMHRLLMTSEAYQMSSQFDGRRQHAARSAEPVSLALPEPAAGCRDRARLHPRRQRRAESRDGRTAGVSQLCSREVLAQMTHGIWKKEEDGPESGGAASTSIASAACRSRCSNPSTCRTRTSPAAARAVSTVPTQALMLLNDDFVLRQAELFAQRVAEARAGRSGARSTSRIALRSAAGLTHEERCARTRVSDKPQVWPDFTHVLLNLNEFVYLR